MRFRSKPSEVEAVQWTGDNFGQIEAFINDEAEPGPRDQYVNLDAMGTLILRAGKLGAQGWVPVPRGYWIVRRPGDRTHHWPVDPEDFTGQYTPATGEATDPQEEKITALLLEFEHWVRTKAPYQAPEVLWPTMQSYARRAKEIIDVQ